MTLHALDAGMPSLGIKPAPTKTISNDLQTLIRRWSGLKTLEEKLVDGQTLRAEEKTTLVHTVDAMLANLDVLVEHYAAYATKHH